MTGIRNAKLTRDQCMVTSSILTWPKGDHVTNVAKVRDTETPKLPWSSPNVNWMCWVCQTARVMNVFCSHSCRREHAVRSLLCRNCRLSLDEEYVKKEAFMMEKLHIPAEWIHEAKVPAVCHSCTLSFPVVHFHSLLFNLYDTFPVPFLLLFSFSVYLFAFSPRAVLFRITCPSPHVVLFPSSPFFHTTFSSLATFHLHSFLLQAATFLPQPLSCPSPFPTGR